MSTRGPCYDSATHPRRDHRGERHDRCGIGQLRPPIRAGTQAAAGHQHGHRRVEAHERGQDRHAGHEQQHQPSVRKSLAINAFLGRAAAACRSRHPACCHDGERRAGDAVDPVQRRHPHPAGEQTTDPSGDPGADGQPTKPQRIDFRAPLRILDQLGDRSAQHRARRFIDQADRRGSGQQRRHTVRPGHQHQRDTRHQTRGHQRGSPP